MSIRSKPIEPMPRKKGYVPRGSKGHYTEAELVARCAKSAMARGAKWFDYKGETYILRGGKFVAWWNKSTVS